MAATMWRMTVALLLCAALLNDGVMCQDDDVTDSPATDAPDSPVDTSDVDPQDPQDPQDPDATATAGDSTDAADTDAADMATTDAPGALPFSVSMDEFTGLPDFGVPAGDETSGTSGTTVGPAAGRAVFDAAVDDVVVVIVADTQGTEAPPPAAPETDAPLQNVFPVVECVDKDNMATRNLYVKAVVKTPDCETTRGILEVISAAWCHADSCRLDIFQEGTELLVASPDAEMSTVVDALESENIAGPLGVSEAEPQAASSGSSVFVAVLLTGLLLAAALIGGYCLKSRRGTSAKGMRLAEEAYPSDENQGNTLVSVAPLSPPAETTPEKPTVNGEAPPAEVTEKTPPPPTNGTSTAAKNADTEL